MDRRVNVDLTMRMAIVHLVGCPFNRRRRATPFKGDGVVLRDGAWLDLEPGESVATRLARAGLSDFDLREHRCGTCHRSPGAADPPGERRLARRPGTG